MHEVLVNRLGGLSLPRKSVVRLTDRPDMTLDVYRGRKTTIQPTNQPTNLSHKSGPHGKGFFLKENKQKSWKLFSIKNDTLQSWWFTPVVGVLSFKEASRS